MIPIPAFDSVEAGRRLGHDLFRYRHELIEPDAAFSIREGFAEACVRRVPRRLPDRHERKWLQIRLNAQRRGRVVADDVTPALLRLIDVSHCPVLRTPLTHGTGDGDDWSVDRLNNDGAYAAHNLAVMSARANRSKGCRGFEEVWRLAQHHAPTDGLSAEEWLRVAALMLGPCFATRAADAPTIPLNAPIPLGTARPAVQQIQHVFTMLAAPASGKNRLIKSFATVCTDERSRTRLRLAAEAVHLGLKRVDLACDVWLQPGVLDAFADWRGSIDLQAWAAAGAISRVLAGARLLPRGQLQSWHLATRGYAC